jgi:hypothetical protein
LYPDIDLSILYLEEGFYESNGKKFADKNDFIRVSTDHYPIGTDVGVIGYPLCKLDFEQLDVSKPKMGNILMRADKGVINCKYNRSLTISNYEFTMSFNPGNSGGPIFDIKSGKLVSVVHGFKSVRTNIIEITLSDDEIKALKIQDSKNKTFIETQSANYSIGYTSASFIDVCKEHNIPLF